MCLASQLLGPQLLKEAVLELNASDDRGIDIVRNTVKQFATKKVNLPPGRHKIIILDEADSMTAGAQQALRRIMEIHSNTTRFALACNTSSKVIEPIQSRCAVLRFGRLDNEQLLKRLVIIAQAENLKYTPDGMEGLLFTADGDMRQAINNMQSTCSGFGFVNAENVFKVCDQPHPALVQEIVDSCINSDGYSMVDIVSTFFRVVKYLPRDKLDDGLQLDFIKVWFVRLCSLMLF